MTTVPARARFVIYRDEPSSPPTEDKPTSTPANTSATVLAIVTAGDKENLHPVTGRRPTSEDASAKKRKTNALATKLLVASGKARPEPHASPKKRKLSAVLGSNRLAEKKEPKKEKRMVRADRTQKARASSRVQKVTDLPRLDEEVRLEEEVAFQEQTGTQDGTETVQTTVDAKCYDLTVLPLADVSKAFEQTPALEEKLVEGDEDEVSDDEADTKANTDDSNECKAPSPFGTPSKRRHSVFSTPERKRIYSAFTFASPSPAGRRYALSRGSSMDRFSDLDFDPIPSMSYHTLVFERD